MRRPAAFILLVAFTAGCGTLDGDVRKEVAPVAPLVMTHPGNRVNVSDAQFRQAMAWLTEDAVVTQLALRPPRDVRVVLAAWDAGSRDRLGTQLGREYSAWCQYVRHGPADCLSLGTASLGFEGKRGLALSIAIGSVMTGVADVVGEFADPLKVEAMVVASLGAYLLLLCAPEPISKVVAAVGTVALYAYLGSELWDVVHAYERMLTEVDSATTFAQVQLAGERFGHSIGQNATRILIMLATACLGSRMDSAIKRLPGFAEAGEAVAFEAPTTVEGGSVTLAGVLSNVSEVVLGKGGLKVIVTGTVAMASHDSGGGAPDNAAIRLSENRVKHIFRSKTGHLPDTPENRKMLQDLAQDESARLGVDRHGNVWSARLNPDGSQTWVQVRDGEIINGGLNQRPHAFDSETGLAAPIKPGG